MEENNHRPDLEHIGDPDARHEHKDVNVRGLVKFVIIFIAAGILIHVFLWVVFGYFRGHEAAGTPSPSLGIGVDARRLPPEPRLQAAPIRDLNEMRAAENEILEGYGWVDRKAGAVRIPIGRAMELVAKEGLPARQAAPVEGAAATVPSNSGLGPVMTREGGPLHLENAAPGQTR